MKKCYLLLSFLLALQFGNAQNFGLQFNGNDERLIIPSKPQFNAQAGFTIEAWIYAYQWKSQVWQGSIVNKDTQGPDRGFAFRCGDNGKLSFVMAVDNAWEEVFTPSIMNNEQWHHVAVVLGTGTMTLYVDGQQSASATYSGNFSTNDLPLNIAASSGFPDRHFNGIIDEVRIWNVARTVTELTDNSATNLTGTEPGLVAYFPMNEGTGATTTENLVDANCSASFDAMDESNWVDGYTIPDYDISIQPIKGLDVYNLKSRPIKISTELKNLGIESLSDVEVTVALNGSDIFTETVNQTIISGEQITYDLITPIDLIGLNNPTIEITAFHPDDQNTNNNSKSLTLSTQPGNTIRLFDGQRHNFGADGQNQFTNVLLPSNLTDFEKLLLHINLDCPAGGCDPWDQPAKIIATTNQGTFEIARYVTPYGIACGPWTVDVSDFKNVLTGPVTFQSFIQVWGANGWSATIDLELVEGNNPFPFYKLHPLWQDDYLVYGDPNIDDDLAEIPVTVDNITEASHVRMTITGHGQGNTNNAAEFSQNTHEFQLDGATIDNHLLWKADCASNECDNQSGNWLFARAGWCPGQEVTPYIVNTTGTVSAGSTINLDYELADYTNLLNTGYNSTGHTEPHFRVHSFFVERSTERYEDYRNLIANSIDPTINLTGTTALEDLSISITNTGNQPMSNFNVSYFINNTLVITEPFTSTIEPGATAVHDFATIDGFTAGIQNVFYGVISHSDDQNIGDDIVKNVIEVTVATNEIEQAAANIKVFPNPVYTGDVQVQVDPILEQSQLELIDTNGKVLDSKLIDGPSILLNLPHSGIYFLKINHPSGFVANRKLVVVK